jgi:hypothetical protein
MTRANPYSPSINAGEISPRLHARTDFVKYPNALEICQNLIPLAEGGAMRRSGFRFVKEIKSSAVKGRLKRFLYSTTQAYMLELGAGVMRFYKSQAQITAANITGSISNGTFATDLTSWTDKDSGGSAASTWNSGGYMDLLGDGTNYAWRQQTVTSITNGADYTLKFRICGAPGDVVYLRVGTTDGGTETINDLAFEVGYHCYTFTAGATTIYIGFRNNAAKSLGVDDVSFIDNSAIEIDTPYAEGDLYTIEGPQSADVLYLFHPSYPVHKLERFAHTSWSLVEVAWQDGPWLDMNDTGTTLTPGATSGLGVTATASAVTGINDGQGFLATDIGRLVRIDNPASGVNWGWGIIVGRTSSTVVTVDVKRAFGATTADTRWRLGAWSATTGYPACGAFFEQRMIAANTGDQPQTFWASQTADFENFSPDSANASGNWDGTVEDDDGFDYTISADDVHAIRWLSPGSDTLMIGTVGGQWTPSSTGAVLTPTDIVVRLQTSEGCAQVQPIRVGNVVLFVQRAKRKVRESSFDFATNGYKAEDMTRLAQHITKGGIVEMAFAEEPNSLLYAVRSDGVLLSMTYRREEDVVGWSRHIVGGSFGTGNAVVESVSVIPGANGTADGQIADSTDRDEVWAIIKRTINGSTKRYIEVMEGDFEGPIAGDYETTDEWKAAMLEAQKDAYFADSLITYDGTATTTISGLDHLEGQVVKVLADGAIASDATVSSGQITLDSEASKVQIGLAYTHRGKTLKMEAGAVAGTAVGKKKRIHGVTFVLLDSHVFSFSDGVGTAEDHDFREVADAMDSAAPLFSGEKYYEFAGDWVTDARIVYESDAPVPFHLSALAPEVTTIDLK